MKRISKEDYHDLFCQWQNSGLSKADFAARQGISKTAFYYWAKKLGARLDSPGISSGFSRISIQPVSSPSPVARINYPSGVSIDVFGQIDPATLKSLLV